MLTETDYMVVSGTTDTASVTSDSYNSAGQLLYSVNGVGDTTAYSYDADGNTVQEVDGYGTTDSATTQYQYDRAGGQTAIIDPAGDTTNFALNADGQTVGMTEDLGTSTSSEAYTYNLAGQLVTTIDENGGTESYVNDADGRVTGETWYNSGGTAVESFSYSYDEAGNMLTAMNTEGTDTFSYSFTYNAAGEVLTVSEPFGVSLSFGYNLAGERTTVSDSFGGSESLTYDADGDLTSLTYNVSGSTVSMNFTYNQAGQQTQESMYYNFGLIATVSESHDADGDVLTIVDTNTSAATIDSFSYAYDLANEVTTESDYSGASTSYSYNAAGELINAGTQTYNYDAAGDADSTGDTSSGGNEQTSFVDPATGDTLDYTYDNAGNELTKIDTNTGITWTYGYNNANQVVTATETNSSSVTQEVVNYEYDAFGNILKGTTTPYVSGVAGSSTVTEFAVDGWNPAKSQAMGDSGFDTWAVMNGSGALQTRNIIGNQIDQILARIDNATNGASDPSGVYFTLTDKDGSVRDVLNSTANAAPVDVITYDAWGNILSQTSTNGSVTTPSDYLGMYSWDGYDYDTADSLYLDHARIYDAASQRWMSQDPMGYAAGDSNLYRYVNNAPTNHDDPSGFVAVDEMTEEKALTILNAQIKKWKENKYDVAASFLQRFIDKKGGALYTLSDAEKDQVMNESEPLMRQVVSLAIEDNKAITCSTLNSNNPGTLSFNGHVRWQSTAGESLLGSTFNKGERAIKTDNDLFYAYGGADLKFEGTITNVRFRRVVGAGSYFIFDVKSKVTITDNYTFAPQGPAGLRLWVEAYAAANFLETQKGYKSFDDTVTFEKVYTGFKSNNLNGYSLNTERPLQPGEQIVVPFERIEPQAVPPPVMAPVAPAPAPARSRTWGEYWGEVMGIAKERGRAMP